MEYNFSKLQNGSDIRGVALDLNPDEKVNLDTYAVERIAEGFLIHMMEKTGKAAEDLTIALGRDSRLSGPDIEDTLATTLSSYGVKVLIAGLASTPAMFMSCIFPEFDCDGAIMITASHLPQNRNGMKFFDKNGGFEKSDIKSILNKAEEKQMLKQTEAKETSIINLMARYAEHLRSLIITGTGQAEEPLKGLKITVDAGNGAGGFYAEYVLAPLGADVSSSQFLLPDGTFPNHMPNPENKEAMASICNKVKEAGSDLGIIFDTDVDRASAVDENGKEINRNGIVALAAALIADHNPQGIVVTDSITSTQLNHFITDELGMNHLRFKRGYRNVIGRSIELCNEGKNSPLAIETSGHAAYRDNYFLDDGAYLATKIVVKTALLKKEGKGISSLIAGLEEPAEAKEIRFPLSGDNFKQVGDMIIDDLKTITSEGKLKGATLELPNYEGVRIKFDDQEVKGWMLLRKSLHDPIMPLNMESDTEGGILVIADRIRPVLSQYRELNIAGL